MNDADAVRFGSLSYVVLPWLTVMMDARKVNCDMPAYELCLPELWNSFFQLPNKDASNTGPKHLRITCNKARHFVSATVS